MIPLFRRRFKRTGPGYSSGPIVLFLLGLIVIPTVCVLWFMIKAMENESLAVRQRLAQAHQSSLFLVAKELEDKWENTAKAMDDLAKNFSGGLLFKEVISRSLADSLIYYDDNGRVLYPNQFPPPSKIPLNDPLPLEWRMANNLEQVPATLQEAADKYQQIAERSPDANGAARAWQARARCLAKLGQTNESLYILTNTLSRAEHRNFIDENGRLVSANAELMALELLRNASTPGYTSVLDRLKSRLKNYADTTMGAAQRRFLMNEVLALCPEETTFATLHAENLAAHFVENQGFKLPSSTLSLQSTPYTNIWQGATPESRIVALYETKTLVSWVHAIVTNTTLPSHLVTLLPPGVERDEALFVSVNAGAALPGWRLGITFAGSDLFDSLAHARIATYIWTSVVVIIGIVLMALLAVRLFSRQIALARLKNDLVATVSHELKTPLASMRLLVDTLLHTDRLHEPTVREYLVLISRENSRLSRLIENFLTFSRMERDKFIFEFSPVAPALIADAAKAALQERFHFIDCQLKMHVKDDLPKINADMDAMTTALVNLLDNALKYTGETKDIHLNVYIDNGNACFQVTDNGIGLTPRDCKKVFQRFYQVDQRLSRNGGGCGLGLSIVDFIVRAHHGTIHVESELGQGSTFTIFIPVMNRNN